MHADLKKEKKRKKAPFSLFLQPNMQDPPTLKNTVDRQHHRKE
jgi:hypothetical protein